MKMFWKYCTYDMIKKMWIIQHGAVESFGRMFLDSFNAFKSVATWTVSKEHIRNNLYAVEEL